MSKSERKEIVLEFATIPGVTLTTPVKEGESRMKAMRDAVNRLDRQTTGGSVKNDERV